MLSTLFSLVNGANEGFCCIYSVSSTGFISCTTHIACPFAHTSIAINFQSNQNKVKGIKT